MFFLMNCLGVTVTYHRYWSHRSFKFKYEWMEKLCTMFAMLSASGSAIGWTNIHRQHHKWSDKEDDPHRAENGVFRTMMMDYKLASGHKYIIDLVRKPYLVRWHNFYFLYIFAYVAVLGLVWGLPGVMLGFSIPAAVTMASEHFTNWINHYKGDHYEPANVWWMNILNFGDGWHKNHHDHPSNYTTTDKWYQFDLSGFLIKRVLMA